MHDGIIYENLFLISESLDVINKRFSSINHPDDLVMDDHGITILDSIVMRLQVVGELLKKSNCSAQCIKNFPCFDNHRITHS